jgi:hypothetical protein
MTSGRSLSTIHDAESRFPVHLLFDELAVDQLEREHILQLSAGILGSIRVRNFFTVEQCLSVMHALASCEMGSYDEQLVQPRISKLGPAAFEYYQGAGLNADYWRHTTQSTAVRANLLSGLDPLDLAKEKLADSWRGTVRHLTSDSHPMFAGMIREISKGGGIHFDELSRELPGAADETPVVQLAFNCHLSMPQSGGELNVFRRRWQPSDELSRDGDYWYPDALFADDYYVSVAPSVGDAVFFDSRNYHRILPCLGEGRRVTLSFFVGISGTGDILIWS